MKFEESTVLFLEELSHFDYRLSVLDQVWELMFIDKQGKWHHVQVTKYQKEFYIVHIDGNNCGLQILPKKTVEAMESFGRSYEDDGRDDPQRVWMPLISAMRKWLKTAARDWRAAHKRVLANYPLDRRFGIIPHSVVQATLNDISRLDKELGRNRTRRFIRLVEEGFCLKRENSIRESMTADVFFEYCKIAYIAAKRKEDPVDKDMTGRQMYERFADGRHEGLLDIDPDSEQEFADWIDGKHPKKTSGGHPWEIKRGGNTTHIDLSVYRPIYQRDNKFKIELHGHAHHRLAETIKMFLAIQKAGLPIAIYDAESVRRRLLAQDNIGLVPEYASLHRANQRFDETDHVYDVLYFNDFSRRKRGVLPYITWEPLPVLKPKAI